LGWNKNKYVTIGDSDKQIITVTCMRMGLGIFFGTGANFIGGVAPSNCNLPKNIKGCTTTWSLGVGTAFPVGGDGSIGGSLSIGPSGVGGTFDAPFASPGAGLYGGIEVCEIITRSF
jgi:hypothetical protein